MDQDLRRLMTLVDHENDDGAVERWFTAVEESFRDSKTEQATSWDEFSERFREKASSFDSSTVNWFLEKADREFSTPLEIVDRFYAQVGAGRAVDSYTQAKTELADSKEAGEAEETGTAAGAAAKADDGDRAGFVEFLAANEKHWKKSDTFFNGWLINEAAAKGFSMEAASFLQYVSEVGDRTKALRGYGLGLDLDGFRDSLRKSAEHAGSPWTDFRTYLTQLGDHEGHAVLTQEFISRVEATDLATAFGEHGVVLPGAKPDAHAGKPDEEAKAAAKAAAMDLGRRSVAALEAQINQRVVITDEQLEALVARQIQAVQAA